MNMQFRNKHQEVVVPKDVALEKWLEHACVCYFKDGYDVKKSLWELEEKGIDYLVGNRFNYVSCMVSKVQGIVNTI